MKKIIVSILALVMLFMLVACDEESSSEVIPSSESKIDSSSNESKVGSEPESEPEPEPEPEFHLGEMVSTDILEFTLDYAEFAIALHNGSAGDWKYICLPKDYDADKDDNSCFVAAMGHTLISLEFTAKNLNRVDMSIADQSDSKFLTVKYMDTEYVWECNSGLYPSKDGYDWEGVEGSAKTTPQEIMHFRTSADIATNVADLTDPFSISFELPTSSGEKEKFTYCITKEDIEAYKDREISLDEAVNAFRYDKPQEHFKNHLSEYTELSTEEITSLTRTDGVKMLMCHQDNSIDKKGNVFDGNGLITYYYKTTKVSLPYTITDNKLCIESSANTYQCSVYRITEDIYLLLNNGDVFGIILIES